MAYRHQDKSQYKESFPSIAKGPSHQQKRDKAFEQAMANSLFENTAANKKKKPVKFSDNAREIALQKSREEK